MLELETDELKLYNLEQPNLEHIYVAEQITLVQGKLYDFGHVFDVNRPSSRDAFIFADDGHPKVLPISQQYIYEVDSILSLDLSGFQAKR